MLERERVDGLKCATLLAGSYPCGPSVEVDPQMVGEPKSTIYTQPHLTPFSSPLPTFSLIKPKEQTQNKNSSLHPTKKKMGSTGDTQIIPLEAKEEEQACLFAMQLASASVLPMVLKSAIELDLLEIIAKAGPGVHVSPAEVAAQLPTQNPGAPVMLDRILRLLASYSVLNCKLRNLPSGGVERLYGLEPVCKFLTRNEDGVSMAPLLLMNQDKILMESW